MQFHSAQIYHVSRIIQDLRWTVFYLNELSVLPRKETFPHHSLSLFQLVDVQPLN